MTVAVAGWWAADESLCASVVSVGRTRRALPIGLSCRRDSVGGIRKGDRLQIPRPAVASRHGYRLCSWSRVPVLRTRGLRQGRSAAAPVGGRRHPGVARLAGPVALCSRCGWTSASRRTTTSARDARSGRCSALTCSRLDESRPCCGWCRPSARSSAVGRRRAGSSPRRCRRRSCRPRRRSSGCCPTRRSGSSWRTR